MTGLTLVHTELPLMWQLSLIPEPENFCMRCVEVVLSSRSEPRQTVGLLVSLSQSMESGSVTTSVTANLLGDGWRMGCFPLANG